MTRLIGLSLSGGSHAPGWRPWLQSGGKIDATLDRCERLIGSGEYAGVYLVGACGWVPSTYCGRHADGRPGYTNRAGYTDHPIHDVVAEFAARWPTTAFIGLPRNLAGLDAMQTDLNGAWSIYPDLTIGLDYTGANTSLMVPAAVRACGDAVHVRLESRPYPGMQPSIPGMKFFTMASRARECMKSGVALDGDIIVYNGGADRNRWIEPEAFVHERRGNTVVQPMSAIEQSSDGGSA